VRETAKEGGRLGERERGREWVEGRQGGGEVRRETGREREREREEGREGGRGKRREGERERGRQGDRDRVRARRAREYRELVEGLVGGCGRHSEDQDQGKGRVGGRRGKGAQGVLLHTRMCSASPRTQICAWVRAKRCLGQDRVSAPSIGPIRPPPSISIGPIRPPPSISII
jgi:ribonuclease E